MYNLKDIDVIILCGGEGTRLRSVVSDRPKPLADINGKPFISILIEDLYSQGFRNIILCTGYMKEQFKTKLETLCNHDDLSIYLSEESIPLGTGGAIKNAESLIVSNNFLVLNGDTFCKMNYKTFFKSHINNNTILSMVISKTKIEESYGNIRSIDKFGVISFYQHPIVGNPYSFVNAGTYFINKDILKFIIEDSKVSLEDDIFSFLTTHFKCYGFINTNDFIDIGIPKRYKKAIEILGD